MKGAARRGRRCRCGYAGDWTGDYATKLCKGNDRDSNNREMQVKDAVKLLKRALWMPEAMFRRRDSSTTRAESFGGGALVCFLPLHSERMQELKRRSFYRRHWLVPRGLLLSTMLQEGKRRPPLQSLGPDKSLNARHHDSQRSLSQLSGPLRKSLRLVPVAQGVLLNC